MCSGNDDTHTPPSSFGMTSRQMGIWEYQFSAYVFPGTDSGGQTGPEFSIQNTRQISPGQFRTTTGGIQYRRGAGAEWRTWEWAVWDNAS